MNLDFCCYFNYVYFYTARGIKNAIFGGVK